MTHILLAVIYLAFISLGLPDSLLGAAWPSMYGELGVPVSRAGMVSMIICFGTIISSLQSSRLTSRFGPGRVTAASVAATAAALLGFSASRSFWQLCLWAVPYGLGAGSVDAALNHYVALHFKSRHMSWLHCMWGVGAFLGPSVMGTVLAGGYGWSMGYRAVGLAQTVLAAVLVISLPLWKMKPGNGKDRNETAAGQKNVREEKKSRGEEAAEEAGADRAPGLLALLRIPMARETVAMFFCYNALETTAGLWASSYLVLVHKVPAERASALAGLFYLGITAGRAVSGFLTEWISDDGMIRLGTGILAAGFLILLFPGGGHSQAGLLLMGLGCAPIYPSVIHSTPSRFGAELSQAVIGVQMAGAYIGSSLMPPFFGFLADHLGASLYPYYLLVLLVVMALMHQRIIPGKHVQTSL